MCLKNSESCQSGEELPVPDLGQDGSLRSKPGVRGDHAERKLKSCGSEGKQDQPCSPGQGLRCRREAGPERDRLVA